MDRNLCTGLGNCVALAPTVFKFDEEDKAVIFGPASIDDETLLEAAASCPYDAIIIEDAEDNEVYP